jgi:hypothetical protein
MSYDVLLLLQQAAIGAVLGAAGQLGRVMVGLNKRLATAATAEPLTFMATRFAVTMVIGAIAGALGGLMVLGGSGAKLGAQEALLLIGLGYAGTDVIEGIAHRYVPGAAQQPSTPA